MSKSRKWINGYGDEVTITDAHDLPANPTTPDQAGALKACKCGLLPLLYTSEPVGVEYGYACPKCDQGVGLFPSESEALSAWNARAPTPTSQDRIAGDTISRKEAVAAIESARPAGHAGGIKANERRKAVNDALAALNALPAVDMQAENERLRLALAFYASEENWTDPKCGMTWTGEEPAIRDCGDIARAALAASLGCGKD